MRKSELALGAFIIMLVCGASVLILHSTRRDQAIAANADIYKQLDLFGEVLNVFDRNMSKSPTTRNSSRTRSTACCRASIRIRAT